MELKMRRVKMVKQKRKKYSGRRKQRWIANIIQSRRSQRESKRVYKKLLEKSRA